MLSIKHTTVWAEFCKLGLDLLSARNTLFFPKMRVLFHS